MDCISKIYAQEGFGGFLKGMEATIWRHAVWNGGYFGVIQYFYKFLYKIEAFDKLYLNKKLKKEY